MNKKEYIINGINVLDENYAREQQELDEKRPFGTHPKFAELHKDYLERLSDEYDESDEYFSLMKQYFENRDNGNSTKEIAEKLNNFPWNKAKENLEYFTQNYDDVLECLTYTAGVGLVISLNKYLESLSFKPVYS